MKKAFIIISAFLNALFTTAVAREFKADDDINYSVSTYIDKTNSLAINQITQQLFEKQNTRNVNFGVNNHANWIRVSFKSNFKNPVLEISYPVLDLVEFFQLHNDSIISHFVTGESLPYYNRVLENKNPSFPISSDVNDSVVCYLKITSGEQIIVPIRITSYSNITKSRVNKNLFNGIYFGIIIVMILYNFFIYLSIRDKSYAYYVLYILFVGITQAILNGYAFKYFWPDNTWMATRSTMLGGALSGLSTIYFVRHFLQTSIYSTKFNKLLNIFAIVYAISIVLCLTGNLQLSYNLINVNAGPGSIILLLTAINIYRKHKTRSALFFIIAWSVFIASIVIFVLKDVGIIAYNTFTVSGLQIGSAFAVTLLSFALADKINVYRKEKEISQALALAAAKENERIIREQNVILERKVDERTNELQNTLKNLQETQSQLVEQEKMASLGQLTAGIAHEINNPINFVTSNIKPLKRDVDMLIDLMNKIEHIAITGIDSEEKTKQIELLKSEYDFSYLIEEIQFLLKGINEGSNRTAEIVKGLRIFSRVDEDDLKIANIEEGIESTLIITNNLINGKVKIDKQYGKIPPIECYPGKLNQVFLNIISNGVYAIQAKYGENKGGLIQISTSYTDNEVIISIKDNGTGMSESTQKKLFEPFFTTKPVGEGTGLGLSIVYNTIKKHAGTIEVVSQENVGTQFIISLPLKQPTTIKST